MTFFMAMRRNEGALPRGQARNNAKVDASRRTAPVRPEKVARGKLLVAGPDYPPAEVMDSVAATLADTLLPPRKGRTASGD
jgi:hypothetical protein